MLYIIGVPIVLFAVGCLIWYLINRSFKITVLGDTDDEW